MTEENINEQRAKAALKRSVHLTDETTGRHFLVYLDRNAFTTSKLFLVDAKVAKELDVSEEQNKFAKAGLFALEIIDFEKFQALKGFEFEASPSDEFASPETKRENVKIEAQIIKQDMIEGISGFGISSKNLVAELEDVLADVRPLLEALTEMARLDGKGPREFRI